MTFNQHRANIRNAMVPMTLREAADFRDNLEARGDTRGTAYADEFIRELEEDFAGCDIDDDDDDWDDGDDCIEPVAWF